MRQEAARAVEGPGRTVLPPFVHRATAGVHEEVGHCGGIQTQLAGDGDLHLLGRSFCFLKSVRLLLDGCSVSLWSLCFSVSLSEI